MRQVLNPPAGRLSHVVKDRLHPSLEARFHHRFGDYELILPSEVVNDSMIDSLIGGETEFALIVEESFLGLCSRFGDAIPWVCAFYSWHSIPREERSFRLSEESVDFRIPLFVSLVDARTGITHAERCTTLSLDFSRALIGAIREQARVSYDPVDERRARERLRRTCPMADSLAASARIRTAGSL